MLPAPLLLTSVFLVCYTTLAQFMFCVVFRALTTRQNRRNRPQNQSKTTNVLKPSERNSNNQFLCHCKDLPAAVSRCRGGACPYALRPRAFQLVGRNESILLRLAAAYELERGDLAFPLDPKSSDAGAATLLFGGALLTLTAVVAGAFFLVLV